MIFRFYETSSNLPTGESFPDQSQSLLQIKLTLCLVNCYSALINPTRLEDLGEAVTLFDNATYNTAS
jgi:hypothetical protein